MDSHHCQGVGLLDNQAQRHVKSVPMSLHLRISLQFLFNFIASVPYLESTWDRCSVMPEAKILASMDGVMRTQWTDPGGCKSIKPPNEATCCNMLPPWAQRRTKAQMFLVQVTGQFSLGGRAAKGIQQAQLSNVPMSAVNPR